MADWNGFKKNGTTYIPNDATARAGVIANTKLIKDTVGWSGKNKFDIEKWLKTNNIAYTKNGNEYTFTTANALYNNHYIISDTDVDVILSSEITIPSGSEAVNVGFEMFDSQGRQITSRGASGSGSVSWLRMNWSTQGQIKVSTPMIRPADILDSTYEPYRNTTAFPRDEQAVLGAVNLFDISKAVNGNLKVVNNTLENSVTDTRSANFWVGIRKGTTPVQTLLTLQNLPSVGHYEFSFTIPNNVDYDNLYIGHNGANSDNKCSYPFNRFGTFYISFDATGVDVSTVGGYILTNVQIALFANAPYVPYAMTNEELTKKVTFNNVEITNVNAGITLDTAWSYAYQVGNLVTYALRFTVGASAINENTILCSFGAECSKSMNADILPRQTGNHFLAALVADTTNHRTDFKTFGGATLAANTEYLVSGIYIAK